MHLFKSHFFLISIKEHRTRVLHISLRNAAEQCGIDHSTLFRLEDGQVPDLISFFKLCKWLNVSPSVFYRPNP